MADNFNNNNRTNSGKYDNRRNELLKGISNEGDVKIRSLSDLGLDDNAPLRDLRELRLNSSGAGSSPREYSNRPVSDKTTIMSSAQLKNAAAQSAGSASRRSGSAPSRTDSEVKRTGFGTQRTGAVSASQRAAYAPQRTGSAARRSPSSPQSSRPAGSAASGSANYAGSGYSRNANYASGGRNAAGGVNAQNTGGSPKSAVSNYRHTDTKTDIRANNNNVNNREKDDYIDSEEIMAGDGTAALTIDSAKKSGSLKKRKHRSLPMRILFLILKLLLVAILAGCVFVGYVVATTPEINPDNIYSLLNQTSSVYDDSGNFLEDVSTAQARTIVTYDKLPKNLINAFVAIEDKTFFSHSGFNIYRIFGAIWNSITSDTEVSGTSTLTQQLARNLYLSNEKSITRKIREAYYAIRLEQTLTKEQIAEAYLNTIYLGYNSNGVQAAAEAYFGVDVSELTLAECAVLASIPKSPLKYAPLKRYDSSEISADDPNIVLRDETYTTVYDDTFADRQHLVLSEMLEQELITLSEYSEAMNEDIRGDINPPEESELNISSYFVDYCLSEVTEDLMSVYHIDESAAADMVYNKGLKIYSSLNVEMQTIAETEFEKNSHFPGVTNLRRDSKGNILGSNGNILMYNRYTYFNDDESFTLKSDEYEMRGNGDMVILAGKRLNIYAVDDGSGGTVPQIEFKTVYYRENGLFYSIRGGYLTGIDNHYMSMDNGNAVISSAFLSANPDFFDFSGGTATVGSYFYSLRQPTIQPQGAMVISDYTTGQIKAIVGGRSLSGKLLYNRADNPRQPGSSMKPIGVYGPALQSAVELGTNYTASSPLEDSENRTGSRVWPNNWYTGYKGWVTLRYAIEQSINVTAVRVVNDIGYDYSMRYLKANGITTLVESGDENDVNPAALALGGMTLGVTPIEIASAYGTFANGGLHIDPTSYTMVTDYNDNIILQSAPPSAQVYDEGVAYVMTDILRTAVTRGLGIRANIGSQPVAGKTGTTTDNYDAWFVGFTPQYSASVWIGNDVNIELTQGSDAAASLWGTVMRKVLSGTSYGSFRSMPSNVYRSGGEYYVDGTRPPGRRLSGKGPVSSSPTPSNGQSSSKPSSSSNRPKVEEEKPEETEEPKPDENTGGTEGENTGSGESGGEVISGGEGTGESGSGGESSGSSGGESSGSSGGESSSGSSGSGGTESSGGSGGESSGSSGGESSGSSGGSTQPEPPQPPNGVVND